MLDYISGSIAPILPIMIGAGFFRMFYAILGSGMLNLMPEESALMRALYIMSRLKELHDTGKLCYEDDATKYRNPYG